MRHNNRIFVTIAAILLLFVAVCAAQAGEYALLKEVTALGDGSSVNLGSDKIRQFTCAASLGGTIPTNATVKFKGSVNGMKWLDLATYIITPVEYLSNGTFTGAATGWTLGVGWAYGTNNVAKTAGAGPLSQALATMVTTPYKGETYLLNFTISGWVKGSPTVTMMGGTGTGTAVTADGTYSRSITTSDTTGALTFTPSASDDEYTIDNISLVRNEDGFHVVNKSVRHIKGSYTAKTGGAADTAITLECSEGGN